MAEDTFGIIGTIQAGAYRVEDVVAEGGFAVVYRAYHDAFQAPVALKCLKIPQQLSALQQAEFFKNFREEAALLFRLSASLSAVVRPLHVDKLTTKDHRFVPFMALEWLEGEALDQLITRRAEAGKPPLGMTRAVRLLAAIARALARAHHFPGPDGPIAIVHRDVKPDNILIANIHGEKVIKLFDFGIAKARSVASQVAGRMTKSEEGTAFTPGYGAPEQWLPRRFGQTGPWTDVWGMALTVLETAIGRPVIDGDTNAMMGTACDDRRRPTPRNEGMLVSDEIEAIFAKAMALDPRDRYADAGTFWDDLENSLGLERSSTPVIAAGQISLSADSSVTRVAQAHVISTFPDYQYDPRSETIGESMEFDITASQQSKVSDVLASSSWKPPQRASIPPGVMETPLPVIPPNPPALVPDLEFDQPPPSVRVVPPSVKQPKPEAQKNSSKPPPASKAKSFPPAVMSNPLDTGFDDDADISLELAISPANTRPASIRPPPASVVSGMVNDVSGGPPPPSKRPEAMAPPSRAFKPPVPQMAAEPTLFRRFRWVILTLSLGVGLSILDRIYAGSAGQILRVASIRLTYYAGLLTILGMLLLVKELVFPTDG
jgi:eukaryotic-like serine/threonine-protein kinase